jgi:uncharacterized protein
MLKRVLAFFLITLFLTGILAAVQIFSGFVPDWLNLSQFAPGLAGLALITLFKLDNFSPTLRILRAEWSRYVAAALIPVGLMLIVFLITRLVLGRFALPPFQAVPFLLALLGIAIGALGEELGWRGILQRLLESKYTVLLSSLITAVLWGAWHVQYYGLGAVYVFAFLGNTIGLSLILAWLLRCSGYNVSIAAISHAALNVMFLLLFRSIVTDARFMLINGLVWLAAAAGLVIFRRAYFLRLEKDGMQKPALNSTAG